jgi:hypothetical protein
VAGGRLPWQGQGAKKKDGAQGEEDNRGILVISHFNPRWHECAGMPCHRKGQRVSKKGKFEYIPKQE